MTDRYVLRFSNNIIEHLGVKLYQNKPTNVIAEYIANSWDAGAENVDVTIRNSSQPNTSVIAITDDGEGMTRDILLKRFLVIGVNRRRSGRTTVAAKGRTPMGRKGIGKLAGFGISNVIEVVTYSKEEDKSVFRWFRFELDNILKKSQATEDVTYEPILVGEGTREEFNEIEFQNDFDQDLLSIFKDHLSKDQTGTCIILRNVRLPKNYSLKRLKDGIADRFALNLINESMKVRLNNEDLSQAGVQIALKDFSIGNPNELKQDDIDFNGKAFPVKYWIGFVELGKTKDWTLDDAGIAIYAHNKIVQGRPFYFGVTGKEILSRYMIGYVYADWLDDFDEDIVSTDRNSINWDIPQAAQLMEWGKKIVSNSIAAYLDFKKNQADKEIEKDAHENKLLNSLSTKEFLAIKTLLRELYPQLDSFEQKKKACQTMAEAWVREPMRAILKRLWGQLGGSDMSETNAVLYLKLLDELRNNQTAELLDLGVKAAMRLHAVRQMQKIIEKGATETHLQRLIEDFPWLLKPEWEILAANQQIGNIIREISAEKWNSTIENDKTRPDFVFLAMQTTKKIVIVELKGAEFNKTLMPEEFVQLGGYIDKLSIRFPNAKVEGVLIGHDISGVSENLRSQRNNISLVNWQTVLQEAQTAHLDIIKTALGPTLANSNDTRIHMISDLTGKSTIDKLLAELRSKDFLSVKDYDGDKPVRKSRTEDAKQ